MKTNLRERRRYYKEHKDEIIADLLIIGRAATRTKWEIPHGGAIYGLEKRWLTPEQIASMPPTHPTPNIPASNNPTPPPDPRHPGINIVPKFPEFNDTWEDTVQLKWLELYDKLIP